MRFSLPNNYICYKLCTMSKKEQNPTIITIEHCGISTSTFINDFDVTIQEMLEIIKGSFITIGFTEGQWENAIFEMADNIDKKYSHTNN